ncbi:MAG TPA: hypothetical protein VMF12_06110 [Xanthobacteraceae bacterium]|nr:hypothetical protein [Xanthobacteraceae bacterium]
MQKAKALSIGRPSNGRMSLDRKIDMWVDQKSRKDSDSKRWHFCIWYPMSGEKAQRVFFWDDSKENCGVVFFPEPTNFSRLRQAIEKLAADSTLREKHRKQLRFPLQRYYSDYGAFPEEK